MTKKVLSSYFSEDNPLLLAVAAFSEKKRILAGLGLPVPEQSEPGQVADFGYLSVLETGVGKANAAGALAFTLAAVRQKRQYAGVLNLGIAGALDPVVKLYESVFANHMLFADEGYPGAAGFVSLEDAGWARTNFACAENPWVDYLRTKADHTGGIATVSTISSTDELALAYATRTGALAEAMEGAALASVCLNLDMPFAELRIISNRCGDRCSQPWDIPGALCQLEAFCTTLLS